MKIDWAAVAAEELAGTHVQETVRSSGLVVPLYASGNHLRCWLKVIGEPAQTLYETPAQAISRWLAFKNDPDQEVVIFHDHAYGQAMFFTRDAIGQIAYIGVTFPQTEQGRTTPGSIWAGECQCWRYGGPCSPPEAKA